MSNRWIIYGATGYTGELIARHAVANGMRPVLAGRSAETVRVLADELGLAYQVFGLESATTALSESDSALILNCAGPFGRTLPALVRACTETRTHYLDLSGEVPEFLAAEGYDAPAKRGGVMVMPGVGFGIVPTDCVAAYLHQQAPASTRLTLSMQTEGARRVGRCRRC